MPQVVRVGKFSIVIYTNDHAPAHVHVRFDGCSIRVLISDDVVTLDTIDGKPKSQDVSAALAAVAENLPACLAKWKELFG